MKHDRLDKILELISSRDVATQEELLNLLRQSGFDVTQATVSRDIKQLRLIKTLSDSGNYVYTSAKPERSDLSTKFDILLSESAVKVDHVTNQIVIKCYTGLANAVCAAFDSVNFDGVVGTIAGDDTILIIMRSEKYADALSKIIKKKLSR